MADAPAPASEGAPRPPVGRPATADDVRGLRRWIIVGLLAAVAASAIAVVALVQANDTSSTDQEASHTVAAQLERVQTRISDRVDALSRRLDQLPTSTSLASVERRLGRVQTQTAATAAAVKDANRKLDALDLRVKALEQASTAKGSSGAKTAK
jgi:TolA-binding protein